MVDKPRVLKLEGLTIYSTATELETLLTTLVEQSCSLLAQERSPYASAEAALLCAYRYVAHGQERLFDNAMYFLDKSINLLSEVKAPPMGLRRGLAEVGWIIEHLSLLLSTVGDAECGMADTFDADPLEQLDHTFSVWLDNNSWNSFGRIMTLAELGVYYVERLPHPRSKMCLQRIGDLLSSSFDPLLFKVGDNIQPVVEENDPCNGLAKYGLLRGLASLTVFISHLISLRFMNEVGVGVLSQCVKMLTGELQTRNEVPGKVGTGTSITSLSCGFGLCCSDLGLAYAIRKVGIETCVPAWEAEGNMWINSTLIYPETKQNVIDASLNHGALGMMHLYRRIGIDNAPLDLRKVISAWFNKSFDTRVVGGGIAGFTSWRPTRRPYFFADSSLFSGSTGMALAIQSILMECQPDWDRLLFVSSREIVSEC